ncbi:MAG: hypothetical protein WAT29_00045 [Thiolinea sp.]
MQREFIIFDLFKAEHFPYAKNWDVDERSLIEWTEWELDKAQRSMSALSGALGGKPDDTRANVRDVDLLGLLGLLEGRLAAVRAALNIVLEMNSAAKSREEHAAAKAAWRAAQSDCVESR